MILLRVYKNKDGRLHHVTHYLTVEGYSRWAKTTKFYNLISLLPVGVLTLASLKNGFFTDLELVEMSRGPSQVHYPPFTLKTSPVSQSELFFLAHKTEQVPTYNARQISTLFKCIIDSRGYLNEYVLGNMHPYTETMLDLNYNDSYTGLENVFEFFDFQSSTIAGYITAFMADLKTKIKDFGLIQQMAEISMPVSRVCHVFQSRWRPRPDIAKQFVLNEMGFNTVNQKYTEQVTTSVIECVGSIDLCIQNPDIGYLGMRLNGFESERPKSQPLPENCPAYICTPKPLYVDIDSDSDFTESLSDPGQNLHMSVNRTKKDTSINSKMEVLAHGPIIGPVPMPEAKLAEDIKNINTFHKTRTQNSPNGNTAENAQKAAKKTLDKPAKKSIATTGYDGSKPGPSRVLERPPEASNSQNSIQTEIVMHSVLIGPQGSRWVYTQGKKYTKTTLPQGLRNDMITQDGTSVVYINREGVVTVNGQNEGYLGQANFSHLGEIMTSYDTDLNENSIPPTPSPPNDNPNKYVRQESSSLFPEPEDKSNESFASSNSPAIKRTRTRSIGPSQNDRSQNTRHKFKSARSITDKASQTSADLNLPSRQHKFIFNQQPANQLLKDLTDKQQELNAHFDEMLQKFQMDVINLPATIKPHKTHLIGLIKQADDLAESISAGTASVKEIRNFIIEMIMDLLQTNFGISMREMEDEIDRLKNQDQQTMVHRMLKSFTRQNLSHIWQINPRPLFLTSNQNQKSTEIQTIYAKYTPTIETYRSAIRNTLKNAEKEAFEVLNRPPTQSDPSPAQPTQPSHPGSILALDSQPETIDQTVNTSDLDIIPESSPDDQIIEIKTGRKRHIITHRAGHKKSKYD